MKNLTIATGSNGKTMVWETPKWDKIPSSTIESALGLTIFDTYTVEEIEIPYEQLITVTDIKQGYQGEVYKWATILHKTDVNDVHIYTYGTKYARISKVINAEANYALFNFRKI